MRSRNIKPGFFRNEDIAELPPDVALFFIGLWCYADFRGNFEVRPKKLRAEIFPYHTGFDPVLGLEQLRLWQFLIPYQTDDGKLYAHIPKFQKHQSPHKKERDAGSEVPDITKESAIPGTFPELTRINPDPSALIPDSLSLIPDPRLLIPDPRKSRTGTATIELAIHQDDHDWTSLLMSKILKNKPDYKFAGEPKKTWPDEFRKMRVIDKRSPERITQVIEWCQSDQFWWKNILSASKLRKQFDQLEMNIKRSPAGKTVDDIKSRAAQLVEEHGND